jgi:hypothetical protein
MSLDGDGGFLQVAQIRPPKITDVLRKINLKQAQLREEFMDAAQGSAPTLRIGGERPYSAKYLEAYTERRAKLAAQIKSEHPTFTDAEIEQRLEVFGT